MPREKQRSHRFGARLTAAWLPQILETSDTIDPDTLALSNAPRGGENLVSTISGDLETLGIRYALFADSHPSPAYPRVLAATETSSSLPTLLAALLLPTMPFQLPLPLPPSRARSSSTSPP